MSPRALALAALAAACGDGERPRSPTSVPPDAEAPPPALRDAAADLSRDAAAPGLDAPRSAEQCNGRDDDGDGLVDELTCPDDFACASARECECGAVRQRCLALCVTLATNPVHCGRCNNACAAADDCVGGTCVEGCGGGLRRCGAACVRLADDPENCGACGRRCGEGVACVEGVCLAREVSPMPGARLGGRRPEFRWSAPGPAALCADARCERVIARLGDAASRGARAPEALAPGVYFWRAGDDRTPRPFRLDARDAPVPGLLPPAPDLNADGLADVVVGCRRSLRVWYGRRGALPERPDVASPLDEPAEPFLQAAGDYDGDVAGDVIVYRPTLAVLAGALGEGVPALRPFAQEGGVPAGDLDGDGRVDWFTLAPPAALLAGSRVELSVALAAPSPRAAAALGDVNGDGYDDLAFGTPGASPPRAYLVAGSASGALRAAVFPPSPRTAGFGGAVAAAGDVNGDGFADVLVGLGPLGAVLYLGGRDGVAVHRVIAGGAEEELLVGAAGDVDGDGFGDVLAVVRAGGEARLYRGGRAGLAAAPVTLRDARWAAVETLGAPGDRDGDGFDDVVAGSPSAGATLVLHGAAAEALTRAELLPGDAIEECGRGAL